MATYIVVGLFHFVSTVVSLLSQTPIFTSSFALISDFTAWVKGKSAYIRKKNLTQFTVSYPALSKIKTLKNMRSNNIPSAVNSSPPRPRKKKTCLFYLSSGTDLFIPFKVLANYKCTPKLTVVSIGIFMNFHRLFFENATNKPKNFDLLLRVTLNRI